MYPQSKKLKEGATEADDFEDETDDESDSEDGEEKVNDKKQKEKEKSKEKEKEKEDVKDHEKVNGFDKKDGENYGMHPQFNIWVSFLFII